MVHEFAEEMKRKPEWQFNDKEKDEHRHRMAKAVLGKEHYQCIMYGMRSIYKKVLGVCEGLKWVSENRNRDIDNMHC